MSVPVEGASSDLLARREALRKSMREQCDALDPALVATWGARVEEGVCQLLVERGFHRVFVYLSIPGEVPTLSLTRRLLRDGFVVAAPRLRNGSPDMQLRQLTDLDADVVRGLWDIPMPRKSCAPVDPREIEVAVVPLTAVDTAGYRIGRGGGCYDGFLAANPHVYAAGVGFEMQRVDTCTPQPWDVPLDALISEERARFFPASRRGSR